jgi:hypothetical protein
MARPHGINEFNDGNDGNEMDQMNLNRMCEMDQMNGSHGSNERIIWASFWSAHNSIDVLKRELSDIPITFSAE